MKSERNNRYASFTPVNLITGFLGSGKTTLLQRLLALPERANTAIIVNEFGDIKTLLKYTGAPRTSATGFAAN